MHRIAASLLFLVVAVAGTAGIVDAQQVSPATIAVVDTTDASAPIWEGWRGPGRDGRVGGAAWPADLSGLRPQWRVELGAGYAGPVVGPARVFVMETSADNEMAIVRALDRRTGAELWRRAWAAPGDVPFFAARSGTWVRSTPAFDGETLYVGDMQETIVALDAATGLDRWRVSLPERYGVGVPPFGFASSPMLAGPHLYVQGANGLVKLDKVTGESIWHAAPTDGDIMEAGAFSSPVMATIGGVEQIVTFTREELAGVSPTDGRTLWRQPVPNFRGMNIVTPSVWNDGVFVSQYRNGSYYFRLSGDERGMEVAPIWQAKASGYMSSAVVIEGHAYQHLGNGRFTAIELETGEEVWRTQPFGEYWSLLYQGDRILALDADGTLRLIRADPGGFRLIDERSVASAASWAHLAVSGREIFVRDMEGLTVLSWDTPAPVAGGQE